MTFAHAWVTKATLHTASKFTGMDVLMDGHRKYLKIWFSWSHPDTTRTTFVATITTDPYLEAATGKVRYNLYLPVGAQQFMVDCPTTDLDSLVFAAHTAVAWLALRSKPGLPADEEKK